MRLIFLILLLLGFNQTSVFGQDDPDSTRLPPPPFSPTAPKIYVEIHDICGCENDASFPGGAAEMQKWVTNNVQYPLGAKELGIRGEVYLGFIVEQDGSLTNIEIYKGAGYSLNQEAIRLVKSMPPWFSSELNGRLVRTRVRLPITFELI